MTDSSPGPHRYRAACRPRPAGRQQGLVRSSRSVSTSELRPFKTMGTSTHGEAYGVRRTSACRLVAAFLARGARCFTKLEDSASEIYLILPAVFCHASCLAEMKPARVMGDRQFQLRWTLLSSTTQLPITRL